MKLAILLTIRGDADDGLAMVLHRLARGLDRMDRLVIIDEGSQDGTRARLRAFSDGPGRGAHILYLEQGEAPPKMARALARRVTGAEYVLGMGRRDLLVAEAVSKLETQLQVERPDVLICPHGWWVAGPSSVLLAADAERVASADDPLSTERYLDLLPDPRRLILRDPEAEEHCLLATEASDLAREWDSYDAMVSAADEVALCPDMVVLRPLPKCRTVQAITAARARLAQVMPRAERAPLVARMVSRIEDELTQVDAANTDAILAAARDLFRTLTWRERRVLRAASGSAARLLATAGAGDYATARSLVAQLAATRDRACMRALSGEIGQLRVDIDRALPGPDYLMELYERVRPR